MVIRYMKVNSQILIRPIMSEKSNKLASDDNKYVFEVALNSCLHIGFIFITKVIKKAKVIILMTSNMDYGLFGTRMAINNPKDIIKRI